MSNDPFDIRSKIKQIIKQALTEDYTKENNKVFSLSDNTLQRYKLTSQFISFIEIKSKENLLPFLSDEVIFGNKLENKEYVVDQLLSAIPCHFSEIQYCSVQPTLSVPLGGNPQIEDCVDCPEDVNLFAVPWEHTFCFKVWFALKDKSELHINYFIKFDENNKISMIDRYMRKL